MPSILLGEEHGMYAIKPVVFAVALTFCALTAEALVAPADKDPYDSGCIVDFSTAACFGYNDPTGTTYTGPTATACQARYSNNSRCRSCVPTYYDNGQPKPYLVCGYVGYSAECSCKNANTANCTGQGACTYSWQ